MSEIKSFIDIEGWFSNEDAKFIQDICSHVKQGTIIEIGCFKGRSTASWIKTAIRNHNEVYIIDNFFGGINAETEASKIQRKDGNKIKEIFIENMEQLGVHRSDYHLYHCNSIDAIKYFKDNSIDMVFVDSDHAYESVVSDIKNWWPKIIKNGILSGHDYNNLDVKRAVNEFALKNNLKVSMGGNCWKINK